MPNSNSIGTTLLHNKAYILFSALLTIILANKNNLIIIATTLAMNKYQC